MNIHRQILRIVRWIMDIPRSIISTNQHAAPLWFLILITGSCLSAPWICAHDPHQSNLEISATAPSMTHWFGTDTLGRDLLSRTLAGGRVSLAVALTATSVSLLVGIAWGTLAAWSGGWRDALMMRVVDLLFCLPFTLLVILLLTVFERSFLLLFLAIGLVEWLTLARIVRAEVLQAKNLPYIEAAKTLGLSPLRIAIRHLIPNISGPILVYTLLTIPSVILMESSLSFLGLGIQPPNASWGSLIQDGASKVGTYPWLIIFPSLFFMLTLLSLNLIGESMKNKLQRP
jgi:oligopeptide transport system permease protein